MSRCKVYIFEKENITYSAFGTGDLHKGLNPFIYLIITSLASNKVLRNTEIFDFVLFREVLTLKLLQQQQHKQQ